MRALTVFPIPTGGAVGIKLTTAVSGTVSLFRAVSGLTGLGLPVALYSGVPLSDRGEQCFYLDVGDNSPGPLLSNNLYVYILQDVDGTTQSPAVAPVSSITLDEVDYTPVVIGLLQGAVNAVTLPTGIPRAQVMHGMPLAGLPRLPLVAINPDLEAQTLVPIGVDDENVGDLIQPGQVNRWTSTGLFQHMMRVTIMAENAPEREYYKHLVMGVLRTSVAYAFSQFGADVEHSIRAAAYQIELDQTNLMIPGFYAADVLFEFTASSNITVVTNYSLIETITVAVSGSISSGPVAETDVQVPLGP